MIKTMKMAEMLARIETGKFARRLGWHNGLLYIYIDNTKGFSEPFMATFNRGVLMDWPYSPLRADWCTDYWILVSDKEAADQRERAIPSQAGPKSKSGSKRPKGPSASSKKR